MSINPHPLLIKNYYKLISYDKTRFLVVGGLGFVVNFSMLALVYDLLNAPILPAQIVAGETALLATFVGNSLWTFLGHHHVAVWKKLIKFHISALAGLTINSTFVVTLVRFGHLYYGLALVVGSIAGLVWNYTLYKKFVFRAHISNNN